MAPAATQTTRTSRKVPLDTNSAQFAYQVSAQTGIDTRVIVAWMQQEGAYAQGGTGGYNYLNLRPARGDVGVVGVSAGNFDQFGSLSAAVQSTTNRLRNPFASGILRTAASKPTPARQIGAIASSGWDAGGYGGSGGKNLVATYESIFGKGTANTAYQPPSRAVSATAGTGSAADAGSSVPGSRIIGRVGNVVVTGDPLSPSKSGVYQGGLGQPPPVKWEDFLGKLSSADFWLRILEITAGAGLVLLGLYLLARDLGISAPPAPGPVGVAARAVE